jgi:hypothetical protein
MATPVAIPPEDSIYDLILRAMNEKRYDYVVKMYEILTHEEHLIFKRKYVEIYNILNEIYVREKMATATLTSDS